MQKLLLLVLVEHGLEFEHVGNDGLLHLFLVLLIWVMVASMALWSGLSARMRAMREVLSRSTSCLFLARAAMEQGCLLLEELDLFRLQGQLFEEHARAEMAWMSRAAHHADKGRRTEPCLPVMGVGRGTEEGEIQQ